MTYTFKLSRRLAASRLVPAAGVLLLAACGADAGTGLAPDQPADVANATVVVSPKRLTAEVYQPTRFTAFGLSSDGDSLALNDIEWSASGGSVSPDGVFSASDPGTYELVALRRYGKGKKADTSTVVVVPSTPKLVSLSISPDTATLAPGATRTFTASGTLSDGTTTAVAATWTATGGSVDAGGVYTAGTAAGAYRVIATAASGQADTASVAVTAPATSPAPTGGSNEPTGFTLLSDRPFNAKTELGWYDRGDDKFSIIQDAKAPKSASSVGQALFPAGFAAGSGPIYTSLGLTGQTRLYMSFWVQFSSNWYGNDAGVNKIWFIWMHGNPSVYLSAQGAGTAALQPQVRLQNIPTGSRNLVPNLVSTAQIKRGAWQRWELVLVANTPGQPDGQVEWWIDGAKVGSYSGIEFADASQSNRWEKVVWNPTYGGAGNPVPADQFQRIDHVYVSGR